MPALLTRCLAVLLLLLGAVAATTPARAATPVANTAPPTISGTPQVGQTLTATQGAWDPGDVTISYQWLSQGVDTGGTGPTYSPGPGDIGRVISVRVTATRPGYDAGTATSAPTAPVARATTLPPPLQHRRAPRIHGRAVVGATLRASPAARPTWSERRPTPRRRG